MADELIFRIGFDLEAGVKEAMKDGDLALGRIEKALAKKPIIVKMRLDQQERLSGQVKSESKKATSALSGLKKEMAELNRQWNTLTASERGGEAGAKLMAQYRALSEEAKGYITTLNAAVKLEDKLARQRERSADAAQKAAQKTREYSDELNNQDGYVSRLLKRMAVYAGYSMATTFLTSVRDVTAEFELQRVSLGAIIQDQQKANQIFSEIKSFALTSPLKILDLTKYTKQVAAYGFETEKLFDTTKMLADISIGLGVDMSRITLFMGQVFATGYLRASEVRQATEAGIPLVDKLAKKLEELNGRAYTAAEVMDMISKRAISFEMVESVFKDMTSAGGEFYNMQVKQSQTLFGMWSKLGDAAAVMYDQIGNTSSINEGMKSAIGTIELLMRNWKTTARVLDTISVALVVYVVGLKNAAIASEAVTTAEAARLAITNRQIIATPKLIAAIIGQNTATKLSTTLTKAHTVAMLNQSTATNVLSRGFWRLTAAMLANPWVAAAAGIALVVTALIHFIGNTETAAERAEKLNNSVASLKNLEDTTKPLIDTYNELINKTERTAEEQKKLSEVTHELAKQYPGAITAIGNFGEEVELAADKLNQLYQAEKQARMSNTRYELGETEKKIKEVEAEIEKYQQQLAKGEKTIYKRLGDSGLRTKKVVPLTEEDKGNILKQIDKLRYGEDGQSGLFGLQQSAEAARRALGLIPSEATQAVEKFGAWKKTLTTFRQQVGDVRVQLFDDSTINQFGSLEEALKKTAEEYKKNIALVATYDETLKSASLTSEERAKIETERAEADAMANLAEKALKYYNAMSLLNTSTSGRGTKSDNRLQNLQEIERTLTSINKKYEELAKTEGNTAALEYVRKNYDSTLKYINKLGEQFNLNFAMPTDFKDLQSYRKAIQGVIEQLKMKGYEKAAIELELKISEGNQAQSQKEIQAKLKDLADRISRTKTAKEFYEKILSQTGDVELATRVSLSIYGSTGEELFEDTVAQIREVFKSGKEDVVIDLEPVFDMTNQRIDYKMLADIYEKCQNDIIEKNRDTAQKIVQEGQKTTAANIANWQKELAKAQSFEEQRTAIIQRESEKRAKIIKEVRDPKERNRFVSLSYDKQAQDLAKLAVDEFKSSDDYIKVFQDLDRVSTQTLDRMKKRLQEMIATVKDTENVDGLKSLVEQLDKINEERETRNPIEGVIDSFKEYAKARKDYRTAEANEAKVKAEFAKQEFGLDMAIQAAKVEQTMAQKRVTDLEAQGKLNTDEGVAAQLALNDATTKVTQATEKRNKAVEKVNKAEQNTTDALDAQKAAIAKLSKNVNAMANAFRSAASSIQTIADMIGIAEDSELGDIVNGLVSGLNNAATIMTTILTIAIAIEAACWWLLAIGGAIAAFSAIGSWLTGSKVRKANKELERQQYILDQLQYSYKRLEEASKKLFGTDYIDNYNSQIRNLKAQQTAYLKQAEAERSKGKKRDGEKIQQYLDAARDAADEIKKLQDDLVAQIVGTDVASAARDFANAWLDAYLSFGSTTDAIKEKFDDMIKNMIVNMVLAQVVKRALEPIFKMIDDLAADGELSADDIAKVMSKVPSTMTQINDGLSVGVKALEAAGVDISKLREGSSEFSGIAKNIAGATSEEINTAAAIGNTVMYHTSHLPIISQNVAAMYQLMSQGKTALPDSGSTGWTDWQTQAMENYNAIARNTADTVVRCERAAVACEAMAEKMGRAFRVKGATSGFNMFLNS